MGVPPATLDGCVALVTGGTAGIGAAIAAELAGRGAAVFSAGRRQTTALGVTSLAVDLSEEGRAAEAVAAVVNSAGRLDILVNNAGVMVADVVESARIDDWNRMAAVNLRAAAECTQAAIPHLRHAAVEARKCADVVFVGSLAGRAPTPGRAFYAATKSGMQAFADVLRTELTGSAVRVGVVSPGLTRTDLRGQTSEGALRRMSATASNLAGVDPMAPQAVAAAVGWMVLQHPAVSITDLTVMPTGQTG